MGFIPLSSVSLPRAEVLIWRDASSARKFFFMGFGVPEGDGEGLCLLEKGGC